MTSGQAAKIIELLAGVRTDLGAVFTVLLLILGVVALRDYGKNK